MTILEEGYLRISLPPGALGRKFDDQETHRLSHCMKAVDFIVELDDRTLFIEVKDPEHPKAKNKDRNKFLKGLLSGALDADLKTKYRDSFLYEWASGRANKPIYYLVLICASSLSEAELLARTDALKRQLPVNGPNDQPWKNSLVAGCAIMNVDTWNKLLPQYPLSRAHA